MKKILSLALVALMLLTLFPVVASADSWLSKEVEDLLYAPGLKPGELMKVVSPNASFLYGYDADNADIRVYDTDLFAKYCPIMAFVIIGDGAEFAGVATLTYEDGATITGSIKICTDGEYQTLVPDPTKTIGKAELFVPIRAVRGVQTQQTVWCNFTRDFGFYHGGDNYGINMDYTREPLYAPSRPKGSGSVYDYVYNGGDDFLDFRLKRPVLPAVPAIPVAPTSHFSDVSTTHWAHSRIESAYDKGLVGGVKAFDPAKGELGLFAPESVLTKAQVAQILYNAYAKTLPTSGNIDLADVSPTAWYSKPTLWLIGNGLAQTKTVRGSQFFYPNDPAPRWMIVDALYRLASIKGISLPTSNTAVEFSDLKGSKEYAAYLPAITAMQRAGIIAGFPNGTFGPEKSLTRAQMAAMIDHFTELEGLHIVK
jgi:hypothetical protein